MSVVALHSLFERLVLKHRKDIVFKTPFPGTCLDMPLKLERETLHIMPRLPNETVKAIAKGAIAGDTEDMLTLSMMYTVGLGLPRDTELAMAWSNFALVQTGNKSFKSCRKELRRQIADLPDSDFSYPEIINKIHSKLVPKHKIAQIDDVPEGKYLVSPLFAGIRLYAVYRVDRHADNESSCYLYDVRLGGPEGDRVSLDVANKLNLPNYIGSHGGKGRYNKKILPDYLHTMRDVLDVPNYFVVTGTLVIPSHMKPYIREALPEVKTAVELFNHFVRTKDEPRRDFHGLPEYNKVSDEHSYFKGILAQVRDGDDHGAYETVRQTYKEELRLYKSGNLVESEVENSKDRLLKAKKLASLIKKGKAIKPLENKVASLKKELSSLKEENRQAADRFNAQYPERVFDVICTNIYSGSNGKLRPLALDHFVFRHLQGVGFKSPASGDFPGCLTVNVDENGLSRKFIKKAVKSFTEKFDDYTVSGVVVQKSTGRTVKNSSKQTPVFLISHQNKD